MLEDWVAVSLVLDAPPVALELILKEYTEYWMALIGNKLEEKSIAAAAFSGGTGQRSAPLVPLWLSGGPSGDVLPLFFPSSDHPDPFSIDLFFK